LGSQVGALDRVQHVAAGAVGLLAAGRVGDRQEDAAAVPLQPVELQRQRLAPQLEGGLAEAGEGVGAVA
jgi:hypothetical protein